MVFFHLAGVSNPQPFCESAFYPTHDMVRASPSSRKSLSNIITKYCCYIYTPHSSNAAARTEQRKERCANQTGRKCTCPLWASRWQGKRGMFRTPLSPGPPAQHGPGVGGVCACACPPRPRCQPPLPSPGSAPAAPRTLPPTSAPRVQGALPSQFAIAAVLFTPGEADSK